MRILHLDSVAMGRGGEDTEWLENGTLVLMLRMLGVLAGLGPGGVRHNFWSTQCTFMALEASEDEAPPRVWCFCSMLKLEGEDERELSQGGSMHYAAIYKLQRFLPEQIEVEDNSVAA